jgi:general secretion pathway protein G
MKKCIGLDRRGFTLIEVIVVAAIIAILAGILVPMIFNQIDESKKTKALGECKTIQSAMMLFYKDLGQWPNDNTPTGTAPYTMPTTLASVPLVGNSLVASNIPIISTFDDNLPGSMADYLSTNVPKFDTKIWKGPYLPNTTLVDPWGKAYLINSGDLFDRNRTVWVVSGGPDGIVQSSVRSGNELCVDNSNVAITPCDDIGIRIQ